MKALATLAAVFVMVVSSSIISNASGQQDRDDYVSQASFIIGTYSPKATEHTPQEMADAAQAFLDSLDEKLRSRAAHVLDSPERRKWTNLPARPDAGGVPFGELNDEQIKAACDLMGSLFSEQGYAKIRNVMLADDQLLSGGRPRPGFGTETFSVVVFGKPSPTEPWAFQIDGHHIGVNVSITADDITLSPSFIGTQPEAFQIADQKIRPLAGEIDGAFKLIDSLNDEQRKQAVMGSKRGQILTGPGNDGNVPKAKGVSCAVFSNDQKELLLSLIAQWVGDLPPVHAERRMKQIKREVDQIHFSWNGAIEPGSDISYTIQGPTLIIEYACQDLGGVPQNHLHTMYRDPTNEYGKQLNE